MKCIYCNEDVEIISSKDFYKNGVDYGYMYICKKCNAYCGCHSKSKKPLGTVANLELRNLRKQAHFYFDYLWKKSNKSNSRKLAYIWSSKQLNIDIKKCHIGMFLNEDCMKVIELCKRYYRKD